MLLRRYDSSLSTDETNSVLDEMAFWFLGQLHDRETAENLWSLVEKREIMDLCSFVPPYDSISITDARYVRQVQAFYQKRGDLTIEGVNPDDACLRKFLEAEKLCKESNEAFRAWSQGRLHFEPDVDLVLYKAQRKIASVLGDVPELSELKFHFGPGATTNLKKQEACALLKLSQTLQCSEEFTNVLEKVLGELPFWVDVLAPEEVAAVSVEIQHGKLSFVPKKADCSRAVVVEPSLNTFCQLGIGDYLGDRLRKLGIDLTTQESKNKDAARIGSLTGDLATLDLSSASDTISKEVVWHLLPIDWAMFLSNFRTGTVVLPGRESDPVSLEKFSSMGNGFTFPLETLIFYALAVSCCEHSQREVKVYGDDIIIPTHAVDLLKKVLRVCGFSLNLEKSFWEGPFRESCGGDYLKGFDIRPVYVKDRLSCSNAFTLYNELYRRGQHDVLPILLRFLDPEVILWGPDGYGDGHLIGDFKPKPVGRDRGWAGATFDTYRFNPRYTFKRHQVGDRVLPAYSIYVTPESDILDEDVKLALGKLTRRQHGVLRDAVQTVFYKKPRKNWEKQPCVVVPGTKGYARISIYLLNPWHPST